MKLDEYGAKPGIVNIRDFSFKWVKHPRDYLKEGQKAVLKVLRVNVDRGHIDLSLKNVNEAEKKEKLKTFKLENRVQKLMDIIAKKSNKKVDDLFASFGDKLIDEYGSLYDAFVSVSSGEEDLKKYIADEKVRTDIRGLIADSIKPPKVEIEANLTISCEEPDGIERIRNTLSSGEAEFGKDSEGGITYLSSPRYSIRVSAEDYKTAEKSLKASIEAMEKYASSNSVSFEFSRDRK